MTKWRMEQLEWIWGISRKGRAGNAGSFTDDKKNGAKFISTDKKMDFEICKQVFFFQATAWCFNLW